MKSRSSADQLPCAGGKKEGLQDNTPKIVLLLTLALVLVTATSIYCYPDLLISSLSWKSSTPPPLDPSSSSSSPAASTSTSEQYYAGGDIINMTATIKNRNSISTSDLHRIIIKKKKRQPQQQCDMFRGEWVPNPSAPYYTNETCWAIHEHQNCIKYGRPDGGFMKWRWKPDGCELPVFNPAVFLELLRGKSLAFVGDSVGRNQMQSLMCLLSRVTYTVDVSPEPDEKFRRWFYPVYNFTLANYWSPYLVRAVEADPAGPTFTGLFSLHLDEADANWTAHISPFDYVVVSAGHWFFRPSMYYESGRLAGCHYCLLPNVTDLTHYYGYRRAFRAAFRALNALPGYRGTTFLRTFAPSHFENGDWDKGGDCARTGPLRSNETRLEGINLEMYMTQLEEFRAAAAEAEAKGKKYRLLDTTEAMLLRPDGHPGRYGRRPEEQKGAMRNDCVHWCLPGPVDTWNDFLLQMLKMEGGRSPGGAARSSSRRQ